jgi:hypothetical protein
MNEASPQAIAIGNDSYRRHGYFDCIHPWHTQQESPPSDGFRLDTSPAPKLRSDETG